MAGRDPRFELLTARGAGGIAVVAIRGEDRFARVAGLLRTSAGSVLHEAPRPRLALLMIDDAPIDEVLVVDRPSCGTLEIHLHGSDAVVQALDRAVGGLGAPPPQRADWLLRHARNTDQLALALEQRLYALDAFLARSPERPAGATREELEAAVRRSRAALALVEPQRIVICGAQNAGKSTLMNRLLFSERVLTGDHPGLTRDPVRETTDLDGYPYEVIDTAGEGELDIALDRLALERLALERARQLRRDGWLLLVIDGSQVPTDRDRQLRREDTVIVRTKTDLPQAAWPTEWQPDVALSCVDPASAAMVRQRVGACLRQRRGLPAAGPAGGIAALDRAELDRFERAREDQRR